MGTPREPRPAKYLAGLLTAELDLLTAIESELVTVFGPIDSRSETLPWTESNFYQPEMGTNLLRRFVSFTPLSSPDRLSEFKLCAQKIEDRFRRSQPQLGRRINIDPGYLDAFKLVLASTKNASQRIYLAAGIYGEATLLFYDGGWHGLPYTYRDYLWPETHRFLTAARNSYLAQLRQSSFSP